MAKSTIENYEVEPPWPIIFFGTSPISLKVLEALNFPIEVIFSKAGSVVSLWAASHKVRLLCPTTKDQLAKIFKDEKFKSQSAVLVDYGLILPSQVINNFPLGIVNVHFSLLPEWRGPNPIRAAILSGQTKTGVSLMLIEPAVDSGPLIGQIEYKLPADITSPRLARNLTELAISLLNKALGPYLNGQVEAWPQPSIPPPTYTQKTTKADGRIDWRQPAAQIAREIRAYQDWPGSYTSFGNLNVIITKATVGDPTLGIRREIGEWFKTNDHELGVQTGNGVLIIERLKPAGKKEISGSEFARGYLRA